MAEEVAKFPWMVLVVALLASVFLFGLDNTVTASSQAVIVRQFHATSKLPWFSIAYLGGAAGTTPFWGQMYSQLNVKWLFISMFTLFEIGSILCGAAPDADAFIVGRAICGVGGAGMYVGLSTIISAKAKPRQRPLYFGLIGLSRSVGTILGPIVGGALAAHGTDWRWAFYLNPLAGALCVVAYVAFIPSFPMQRELSCPKQVLKTSFLMQRGLLFRQRVLRIDWVGIMLLCGCLVSILMAISFGGTVYSWQNVRIIVLFVLAGVLLALFLIQQAYNLLAQERSFPVQFLTQPIMVSLFVSTACSTTSIFVPVYSLPLFYQFVHDDSALQAGVKLLPYIFFNVATLMASGVIMGKWPYYMPWYLTGGCFTVAGSAALYTITASTPDAQIFGFSILLGIGGGAYSQLAFSVIQSRIERKLVPVAMAFCTFAQILGPAIALSISNAVFLNRATIDIHDLNPHLSKKVIQEVIVGASRSHDSLGISPAMQELTIDILVSALRKAFLLPLSAGALTVLLAPFMQRERLYSSSSGDEEKTTVKQ